MADPYASERMKRQWADPEWRRQQIRAIERGNDHNAAKAAATALGHLTKEEKRLYKILRARPGVSRAAALRRMGKLPL
jgi:hypothetical protein